MLAAWSTNGWLPSGHAMRMALDLGLHRALDKLAEEGGSKKRSEEEERNLGASFHPAFVTSHHDRSLSCVRTYLAVPLLVRPSVSTASFLPSSLLLSSVQSPGLLFLYPTFPHEHMQHRSFITLLRS